MDEKKNDIEEKFHEWLDGTLNDKEWENVKSNSENRDEYEELEKIVSETSKQEVPEGRTTEQAWNLLEDQIDDDQSKVIPISIWRRRSFQFGIAASILLLIGFFFVQNLDNQVNIISNAGEHLSYALPDGSQVELNANSNIQYSSGSWDDNRKLELSGEAFFKVEKGSSFSVITENGIVSVLGTQFNVKSRGNRFEVTCTEGKVEVKKDNRESVILTRNMSVKLIDNQLVKNENIKLDTKTAWIEGLFIYENESLQYVIEELERQFDIKVKPIPDISDRKYTGFFEANELNSALESVFSPLELRYQIEGKEIIIE